MNKHLREAFMKQRFRRAHRNVIKANLVEQQHTLFTTFVQPFTDIIDAAKLTSQDILNSLKLSFDILFTLSPKKKAEAIKEFEGRKANIEKKWEPIMKRTQEAMGNPDLKIAALVFAPHMFLASETLAKGYKGAKDLNTHLKDAGWEVPLVSSILGYAPETEFKTTGTTTGAGESASLLSKLAGLFYIEGTWHAGNLILEQEEEDEAPPTPKKEPDFKKAMTQYLEQTGIMQKFETDAEEMYEAQKEYVDTMLGESLPRLTLISALTQASDVDTFIGAIENAEAQGLDLAAGGLDKVRAEIESAAKELAQSKEFRTQIAQEKGGSTPEPQEKPGKVEEGDESGNELPAPDVDEGDVMKAAMKVAFVNAKQKFDEQALQGRDTLKKEALEAIEEIAPDEGSIAAVRSTSIGMKFVQMIEDAKQKIEAT